MENEKQIETTKPMVGYDRKSIEMILNLFNSIPVKTYIEVQHKCKIYEILMNPEYEFTPPNNENNHL